MPPQAKILVVDLEKNWIESIRPSLQSAGYEVSVVNTAEAVLAAVAEQRPALVLLDIRKSGMGGMEVLRGLKARADTRDIPILLLGDVDNLDERIEGLKLGAADSITKPFHESELLARIGIQIELAHFRAQKERRTSDMLRCTQSGSEQNYRNLIEGMLEGFALHEIICDGSGQPVDYRFLSVNPAFEKMTGLVAADTVGRTIKEILPGVEPVWIERYGQVAMTGVPAEFEEHSAGTDYLKEIKVSTDVEKAEGRGPAGTSIREDRPVWCQDFQNDPTTATWREAGARFGWKAVASLPLRKRGKAIGVLVVYSDKMYVFDADVRMLLEQLASDISFAFDIFDSNARRKATESALRESETTMRYIVKHDPNALAVLDGELRYIAVSDRFLQEYNVRDN